MADFHPVKPSALGRYRDGRCRLFFAVLVRRRADSKALSITGRLGLMLPLLICRRLRRMVLLARHCGRMHQRRRSDIMRMRGCHRDHGPDVLDGHGVRVGVITSGRSRRGKRMRRRLSGTHGPIVIGTYKQTRTRRAERRRKRGDFVSFRRCAGI